MIPALVVAGTGTGTATYYANKYNFLRVVQSTSITLVNGYTTSTAPSTNVINGYAYQFSYTIDDAGSHLFVYLPAGAFPNADPGWYELDSEHATGVYDYFLPYFDQISAYLGLTQPAVVQSPSSGQSGLISLNKPPTVGNLLVLLQMEIRLFTRNLQRIIFRMIQMNRIYPQKIYKK